MIRTIDKDEALAIAHELIGNTKRDERASERAGYSIWRSAETPEAWWSDLGDSIEVNFADGNTMRIEWSIADTLKRAKETIVQQANEIADRDAKIREQENEIIKLKAKLYDMICEYKQQGGNHART